MSVWLLDRCKQNEEKKTFETLTEQEAMFVHHNVVVVPVSDAKNIGRHTVTSARTSEIFNCHLIVALY